MITSKIEHHAVLHTAEALAEEYNVTLRFVDLDGHGNPDLKHLEVLLTEDNSKKLG
ncbi:MAG: aminotransferase class V-fold PLP-dependent enzyme [Bacteroidota bacterium]